MLAILGAWQAGIKHLSIKLTAPGRKKGEKKGEGGELRTQPQAGSLPAGDMGPARERGQSRGQQHLEPCSLV